MKNSQEFEVSRYQEYSTLPRIPHHPRHAFDLHPILLARRPELHLRLEPRGVVERAGLDNQHRGLCRNAADDGGAAGWAELTVDFAAAVAMIDVGVQLARDCHRGQRQHEQHRPAAARLALAVLAVAHRLHQRLAFKAIADRAAQAAALIARHSPVSLISPRIVA